MKSIVIIILGFLCASALPAEDLKAYYSSTDAGDVVYYISKTRLESLPSVRMGIGEVIPKVKLPVSVEAAIEEAVRVVQVMYKDWTVVGFYNLTLREWEVAGKNIFHYDVMVSAKRKNGDVSILTIPVLMDGKSMLFCSHEEWDKRTKGEHTVNDTGQPKHGEDQRAK